ncbi:hypothetical protein [Eremococcus coleocola]|uniref:Uncharacterized protein n=1 Tax=Eremococcus coleocola ACS-139-V-Col8 TaxID=908337 RepID=E4KQE8_9LACT|nr:hypothetical protein [Eremococcus coleocola]EFR30902.1 hypothetical protein HMPREF9257_1749 [Eremococcus coleocola ACS-139-V-Col8]
MSVINDNFVQLLNSKKVPLKSQEIENGHMLHRMNFQIQKNRASAIEVIIQGGQDDYADAQVIYRNIYNMKDRAQEGQALELINQLNEMRTGYYNLFLAGDGEIFLRTLMRVGQDPEPLYQTMIMGSGIARNLVKEFETSLDGKKA